MDLRQPTAGFDQRFHARLAHALRRGDRFAEGCQRVVASPFALAPPGACGEEKWAGCLPIVDTETAMLGTAVSGLPGGHGGG